MINTKSLQTQIYNLPSQATTFIGRETEIAELVDLLSDPNCRLLTLVGPGGIGKTRLAIEVANRLPLTFQHGMVYVPLAPINMAEDIVSMMITTLGVYIGETDKALEQLIVYLGKRHLLMIIDNFEHLLDGTKLISDILHAAPHVKIIVTSRTILNIQEEWVRRIKGLPIPSQNEISNLEDYDALNLYFDRARRLQRNVSQQNKLDAIRICQLVDGMPLAIELATSWLKSLTSAEIVLEIQKNIDFLTTNVKNIPEQHRSIQAVFEHSWELCTDQEQKAFRQLSVFRGGFTRDAAENMTNVTLQTLSALVEKSMIRKLPSGRYDMQKLLQQFATQKLKTASLLEITQTAHINYFAEFLYDRTPDIKGGRQLDSLNEIKADFENIRVAWNQAIEAADYDVLDRMMEGIALYCDLHARFHEGWDLLKRAVDELTFNNGNPINVVWNRLRVYSIHAWVLPEFRVVPDTIRQQLLESLEIAKQDDDPKTIMICLWLQAELERISLNFSATLSFIHKAMTYNNNPDTQYYFGRILRSHTYSAKWGELSSPEDARQINQQHMDFTRAIGDKSGLAHALLYHTEFFEPELASKHLQEAINIWRETGDWKSVGIASMIQAQNLFFHGEFGQARQMVIYGKNWQETTGWSHGKVQNTVILGLTSFALGDYEQAKLWLDEDNIGQVKKVCGGQAKLGLIIGLSYLSLSLMDKEQSEHYIVCALKFVQKPFLSLASVGILGMIAIILAEDGQEEYAVKLQGLSSNYSDHYLMGWMKNLESLGRLREELRSELGEEAFNSAWERGKHLDLQATVNDLLVYFDGTKTPTTQPLIEPLTDRELDVLALLARGHSNHEIAENLTIVVGTVKTHTYNIRQKLGVKKNIKAVIRAKELGLL